MEGIWWRVAGNGWRVGNFVNVKVVDSGQRLQADRQVFSFLGVSDGGRFEALKLPFMTKD
jgi:hypothetical protein